MTDAGPVDNAALSNLIGSIYECAIDPSRWPATLEGMAAALEACNGTILSQAVDGASFQHHWGTPSEWLEAYTRTFQAINPLLTIGWHAEVDVPISALQFMTPEDLRKTRFHREFLAPLNWFDFIGVILEKSATRFSMISFTRRADQPPPGERERALIRLLAPHVRRAAVFQGVLGLAASRIGDLVATLDLIQAPVLLFDAAGVCVEANAAATAFLSSVGVLALNQGRIRTGDTALNEAMAMAVVADPTELGTAARQPMSFALTQADGRRFVAHVLPLAGGMRDRLGGPRRAVSAMFIQAVGELRPLPGELLVRLYGLTHAETRLIGLLASARSLGDAAAALGISQTTARTHLRHIFEKTGTRRQSQLLKLVLSALPQAPSPAQSARR
ncbi:MAG: helix-turn-helix transcriptional regulator [Acetobacteraceae bacterium]